MDNNTLSIYIHELRNQCLHMQASFDLFNQAMQNRTGPAILFAGQMVLMPASNISALLWPSRARARGRGENLRKVLQLPQKHPLDDRRLSELLEHTDMKLEEWITTTKGKQIVFDYVGNPEQLEGEEGPMGEESFYRVYNPETHVYYYRGVGYNLQAIANAVADVGARVNAVYRQMFPEQAKAEAEAAEAAQKAANDAAETTAPAEDSK